MAIAARKQQRSTDPFRRASAPRSLRPRDPLGHPYPAGTCVSITSQEELEALEPLWRELHAQTDDGSPFKSWDFTVEWLRHFVLRRVGGATGRFELAISFDARGRLSGALPLFEERTLGLEVFGLALQPFGRAHSMEAMTDEPVVLLRRGCESDAARALVNHVANRLLASQCDLAVVPGPHQAQSAGTSSLSWSSRPSSVALTRPASGPMCVELPGTWGEFTAGLSKSMRDNIAYYPRRLSREVGPWKLRTARTPAEIAVATDQLIELHHRRSRSAVGVWHGDHIGGPSGAAFLRRWFARAAARGEISIITIEVGGQTIAAQAFPESPRCVAVYYSGFDERYYRYSPLTIITAHLFQSAIERGVRRVEFPPGSTRWTLRWGAREARPSEQVSIYAVRVPALLRGMYRRFRRRFVAPQPI